MQMNAAAPSHPRPGAKAQGDPLVIDLATDSDREQIYQLRHEVYARELGQHPVNTGARLCDPLDSGNVYLVARAGEELAGFVSITLPAQHAYSIDKYFPRAALPFPVDESLYEIRLLTVLKPHRGREVASGLMYAAFRWAESHGGAHLVAIGRHEVLDMYLKAGLRDTGLEARSGAVGYHLLHARMDDVRAAMQSFRGLLARLEGKTDWRLSFPFHKPASCFHGGAFFSAVGDRFDSLQRSRQIINADVLDAWFPPSPGVIAALQDHLPWLLRTSPPTGCEGLIATIADSRGVKPMHILPGAGSSDLIFRAFRQWLTPRSHALLLDPTYGEYAHVLEQVIGCTVDRLTLARKNDYDVDIGRLGAAFRDRYDLVVLVNPNSPTGRLIPAPAMKELLRLVPARTRLWLDETYIEYAGVEHSMERLAAQSENVVVCKSMSKVYALSGARSAYLCAGAHQLEALRAITPPWVVSLPAQVAAVNALKEPGYYRARHAETRLLRLGLEKDLAALGWNLVPGVANFILCHLPEAGLTAADFVRACRERGLFLRDAQKMGSQLGHHALRIAVKDAHTNRKMVGILKAVSAS